MKAEYTSTIGLAVTLMTWALSTTPVAAKPPTKTVCEEGTPVRMVSNEGSQGLQVTLIGAFSPDSTLRGGKKHKVQVCEGTTVEYRVTSATGQVSCTVDRVNVVPSGHLRADARIKRLTCMDPTQGSDRQDIAIVATGK